MEKAGMVTEHELSRKLAEELGLKVVVDETMPEDCLVVVPHRRINETEEEWLNRCVLIRNLGAERVKGAK